MRHISNKAAWLEEVVSSREHTSRINNIIDVKRHLLGWHKILQKPDSKWKDEVFTTAKTPFRLIGPVIDTHVSYVVGAPISISGDREIVEDFNVINKKGHYDKANYLLAKDLITYGNAYEYVFVDAGGRIQSKVIAPEDAFPVYDNNFNYTCFVEHWQDGIAGGTKHHIVYYTHSIEVYRDFELIETRTNLTGLPIHYAALNKSEYSQYGRGLAEPLIPVLDAIESLTAKMDDTIKTNILNPVAVVTGLLEDAEMPRDMVGAALRVEVGSEMTYSSPRLDYATMNLLLGTYIEQFFSIAGIPGVVMNQSNVSNLSETSLRMLFTQTETRAKETIIALKDGMMTRLAYIRTLLENQGKRYSDEAFDTLDLSFVTGMPVDTKGMMEVMQMQRKMGAISRQTIIERSPLTNDVAGEIKRIEEEAHNPSNAKDGILGQQE